MHFPRSVGPNIGIGTASPQAPLSVGTVAHLGKGVPTNTSKTCAIPGSLWTNTPPSAGACNAYCVTAGFPAGVVSTQGSRSCIGAQCNFITDFATCAVGSMINNNLCDTCAPNFVCTCLTPGSVFDAEVRVNNYLTLSGTTGAPPAADCDSPLERGRIKADSVANLLWLCTSTGWQSK